MLGSGPAGGQGLWSVMLLISVLVFITGKEMLTSGSQRLTFYENPCSIAKIQFGLPSYAGSHFYLQQRVLTMRARASGPG
jgi:hypothetical protein